MTKEEIYQKMIGCRRIAHDVYCDIWSMEPSKKYAELLTHSKWVLDEIDLFMNHLRRFDFRGDKQ